MTEEKAETVASILIGVGLAGASYYVLKTPSLRRLIWQAARAMITTTGPAWVAAEAKRGWNESRPATSEQQAI